MSDKTSELRLRKVNRGMVQQLIDREYDSLAGIILRLAWQLGLTRLEIHRLQWDQFSADFSKVTVDGRTVPIERPMRLFFDTLSEGELAAAREWVVVSPVTKAHVSEQYISMLASKVLRSVGMDDIKLSDLRSDYVLRQMELYPLDYVAQVANLQYFTLQTVYLPFLQTFYQKQVLPFKGEDLREASPEQIDQMISAEGSSTIGTILDLIWNTELPIGEVATLQWHQVNLDKGHLSVNGKRYLLTKAMTQKLREMRTQALPPTDSEFVFLSVRTRKPIDAAYIARMARELFVKNRLYGMTLTQVQAIKQRGKQEKKIDILSQKILHLLKEREHLDKNDVSNCLNIDEGTARICLLTLERSGRLKRYGKNYYLAVEGHWSEAYPQYIYEYIRAHPGCTRIEIETALGAPDRSAYPHLTQLVKQGKVHREGKQLYCT